MNFFRTILLLTLVAVALSSVTSEHRDGSTPSYERQAHVLRPDAAAVTDIPERRQPLPELVGFERAMDIAKVSPPTLADDHLRPAGYFGVLTKVAKAALPAARKAATSVGRAVGKGITAAKNTSTVKAVGGGLATGAAYEVGRRATGHLLGRRDDD